MYFGIRAGHQYILKGKSINYTLRLKMRTQQPRCPSIAAWINKLWYIYTTEYYSAMIISYQAMTKGWRKQIHIAKWKKPVWEDYTLCSNSLTFWKGKPKETIKRGCLGIVPLTTRRCQSISFPLGEHYSPIVRWVFLRPSYTSCIQFCKA